MKGDGVDVVVVGGGVVGLSAGRALARRGRGVVVCEQAEVGHGSSGSKGSARIFRLGYDEPGYVRMAMVAERLWGELEEESGEALVTRTGQVTFGDELEVLVRAMAEAGAAYEEMRADEVRERFPGLSVSTSAVFEPGSGVIAADVCLRVLGEVEGVEVRQKTRVVTCDDDGRRVRIVVEAGGERDELEASAVVVCGGPWTAGLVFGAAGFRPMATLEQVAYLAPVEVSIDELPVFVERRRPWFYGLPVRSSGLMKVSLHGGGPAVSLESLESPLSAGSPGFPEPPQVGSAIDRPDPALVGELMASTRRVLPGLAPEPVTTERCVYDNSPDGDFVIDRIGNVVFGSGTSGHGFKFGPLLGELLADLASGSPHDKSLGSAADLGRFASGRLRSSRSGGGPTIHP